MPESSMHVTAYTPMPEPATAPMIAMRSHPAAVLPTLAEQAQRHDLDALDTHLRALQALLQDQLADVESELHGTTGPNVAQLGGQHLLAAGGKRLRPLCTLLASRLGPVVDDAARLNARNLAVAVELVHAATLLHDDVVDVADTRRNRITARRLYGNEASIFAGDWVLVEALRRICTTGIHALVPLALDTIEQMIFGEVEQSERARTLAHDAEGYFRVVDGKTAALFRWAMRAGARAGGADLATEEALVAYGSALGIAFQLSDDALDFDGDAAKTGKTPLADLAEGKVTLPLLYLLEKHPEHLADLRVLHDAGKSGEDAETAAARARVLAAVRESGAVQRARAVAAHYARQAATALDVLPPESAERAALVAVAETLALRTA